MGNYGMIETLPVSTLVEKIHKHLKIVEHVIIDVIACTRDY